MDSLTTQFEQLASSADTETRLELLNFAQKMQYSLESPADMVHRVAMTAAQIHVAETLIELGIFEIVDGSKDPVSDISIAKTIDSDAGLISRLMRTAASHGMLEEVGPGMYHTNPFSSKLARKGHQGSILHLVKTVGPAWAALSTWTQAHKGNAKPDHLPVEISLTGGLPVFDYLGKPENADRLSYAVALMGHWKEGTPDWLSVYPVDVEAENLDPDRALFVDVGGGLGHQCQSLRKRYPDLKGRVILQDRPEVLAGAPPIDGVELVPQDFFHGQEIKGAKIYYLRWILHDWPAQSCILILRNLRSAMAPDSRIIVDDMVIPETGAHTYSTDMDLIMMAVFGGVERTSKQWTEIFEEAGLRLRRSFVYDENTADTAQELVRDDVEDEV